MKKHCSTVLDYGTKEDILAWVVEWTYDMELPTIADIRKMEAYTSTTSLWWVAIVALIITGTICAILAYRRKPSISEDDSYVHTQSI